MVVLAERLAPFYYLLLLYIVIYRGLMGIWNKQLARLPMPDDLQKVAEKLILVYGVDLTVSDCLSISPEAFGSKRYVGKKYVQQFKRLIFYLNRELLNEDTSNSEPIPQLDEPIRTVPKKYWALFEKLKQCYKAESLETYADICGLNSNLFKSHRGVGENKVKLLKDWQDDILYMHLPDMVDKKIQKALENYNLSSFHLSTSEQRLLSKYVRRGMTYDDLTPVFLINLVSVDILNAHGFGRKSADALTSLQSKILTALSCGKSDGILIPKNFGRSLNLEEISPLLKVDMERFARSLSEEEYLIWAHRLGYKVDFLTLEELGDKFGVTRERIRQRAALLNASFLRGVRVGSQVLQEKLNGIGRLELLNAMAELGADFCGDSALFSGIALMADLEPKTFLQTTLPSVKITILEEYFLVKAMYPTQASHVLGALQDELGVSVVEAELYFTKLVSSGQMVFNGEHVIPQGLKKEPAIVHVLSGYPNGLAPAELAKKVNDLGICRVRLSEDRPDFILNSSRYIYQSGARESRHMRFFPASNAEINSWLKDIKRVLKKQPHNSMSLMAEYYGHLVAPNHDYYTVRHIARSFGERQGIYFTGRSQVDTISLTPDAECINQKEAVLRLLQSNPPMDLSEIAGFIKSGTESHALHYVSALLSEGEVIHMQNGTYSTKNMAFQGIDTDTFLDCLDEVMRQDNRVHHFFTLASQINRITKKDYSPRFYNAMANGYANERGYHIQGFLISFDSIPWRSLAGLARAAPELPFEDLVAWMQSRVCTSREIILRGIYNSGITRQNDLSPDHVEGLASDVLEELFSL